MTCRKHASAEVVRTSKGVSVTVYKCHTKHVKPSSLAIHIQHCPCTQRTCMRACAHTRTWNRRRTQSAHYINILSYFSTVDQRVKLQHKMANQPKVTNQSNTIALIMCNLNIILCSQTLICLHTRCYPWSMDHLLHSTSKAHSCFVRPYWRVGGWGGGVHHKWASISDWQICTECKKDLQASLQHTLSRLVSQSDVPEYHWAPDKLFWLPLHPFSLLVFQGPAQGHRYMEQYR